MIYLTVKNNTIFYQIKQIRSVPKLLTNTLTKGFDITAFNNQFVPSVFILLIYNNKQFVFIVLGINA